MIMHHCVKDMRRAWLFPFSILVGFALFPLVVTSSLAADEVFVIEVNGDRLTFEKNEIDEVKVDFGFSSKPVVAFEFATKGQEKLYDFTLKHQGEASKMLVCDIVVAEPIILEPLSGGQMQLSGNFTLDEVQAMVRKIKFSTCTSPAV